MGDLTKILDGNVGEVKDALAGKSHVDLQELRKQEAAGKNRTGVLSAIDAALAPEVNEASGEGEAATADAASGPADQSETDDAAAAADEAGDAIGDTAGSSVNGIAPAEVIDTAGAPQQIVPDVDMTHPAVDADPRSNTSATQNRIDFNDPSREGIDVVTERTNSAA